MRKTVLIIFTALAIFPLECYSQSDPCQKEGEKYCGSYTGTDPRKYYCLKQVESELSNSCKAAVKKMSGSMEDYFEECTDDFHKYCKGTLPGGGRIMECLKKNSRQLNFDCRKLVAEAP